MANPAYTVDFNQAVQPAFQAANDMMNIKGQMQQQEIQQNTMRKQAYELDAMQKEKQWNDSWMPVSSVAPQLDQNPALKNLFVSAAKNGGLGVREDATGLYAQGSALKHIQGLLTQNTDFQKAAIDASMTDIQNHITSGLSKLSQAESGEIKLKPEEVDQLTKEVASYRKTYGTLIYQSEAIQKELAKQKAQEDRELEVQAQKKADDLAKEKMLEKGRNERADKANAAHITAAKIRGPVGGGKKAYKESQVVLKDGTTIVAGYDKSTNKYYDTETGEDISGTVAKKAPVGGKGGTPIFGGGPKNPTPTPTAASPPSNNTGDPQKREGYKTAKDVKAAFDAGKIKVDKAVKILKEGFGQQ
jgi:hypothetical protein